MCAKSPERARPLFAYQTIIVREARHCEGTGWQLYDSTFCHQVAGKPNIDWSVLNASFYSTSFLANQNNRGRTCKHCLETDHVFTNCALAPLSGDKQSRGKKRDYDPPQNTGRHLIRGRGGVKGACFAWNDGRFSLPYCHWRHVCGRCRSPDHRESLCSSGHGTSRSVPDERPSSHKEPGG